jgi:RecG-like helicase
MAKRVNVQGQSFAVNQHQHGRMQPQRQGESGQQQQYSGDVLSTRTAKFRNTDQPCLIAYVELENGKVETVNFGPKHDVKDCVQEGETITFSARHGRVNGRPALIAQRVETQQGQMTQIDWSGSRSSRSPQRSFQQDRMESTGWGQSSSTDWQSSSY